MERRKIPGTAGYTADRDGNIYKENGEQCRVVKTALNYIRTSVKFIDPEMRTSQVHRLVALAFLENNNPERIQVNHRDGDPSNNKLENLEWVTPRENNIHSEVMRTGNVKDCVMVEYKGRVIATYANAYAAAIALGVEPLQVWDSIKDKISVKNFRFTHKLWNSGTAPHLRKSPGMIKGMEKLKKKAIKLKDIYTGEVTEYESLHAVAVKFETTKSNVHRAFQTPKYTRIFNKRYQVAYATDEFLEISKEEIEAAKLRGPRAVLAYNIKDNHLAIFSNAKEFYKTVGLNKTPVTNNLVIDRLINIGGWVFLYENEENKKRMADFINRPGL